MKKSFITILFIVVFGSLMCLEFTRFYKEHLALKNQVYQTLEKDSLTDDDLDFVNIATNPNEMKENFVELDDKHRALYKQHFGHER